MVFKPLVEIRTQRGGEFFNVYLRSVKNPKILIVTTLINNILLTHARLYTTYVQTFKNDTILIFYMKIISYMFCLCLSSEIMAR